MSEITELLKISMAGNAENTTASHSQIFSSDKYVFINSVNLHQDQEQKSETNLRFVP